jgi:hypothetical protein
MSAAWCTGKAFLGHTTVVWYNAAVFFHGENKVKQGGNKPSRMLGLDCIVVMPWSGVCVMGRVLFYLRLSCTRALV